MTSASDQPASSLSVVVPIFNEKSTIAAVIDNLKRLPFQLQIIAVDDGSTDGTSELLKQIAKETSGVELVMLEKNRGKGAALQAGFENVSAKFVVIQDADLEYDPTDLPRLIEPLVNGTADVVYGSRFLNPPSHSTSWLHRATNGLLTALSNFFTGLKLTDMETCYKAFRSDAIKNIKLEQTGFGIEPELTAKLARQGLRFIEVAIGYQGRNYADGKKVGIVDLFHAVYCICKYGLRK